MDLTKQGILLGISLSLMIGPLFFAIVQASLERGFRSGMAVGVGIWLSDFLILFGLYRSLDLVNTLTSSEVFKHNASIGGGVVLMAFGLGGLIFNKKKDFESLGSRSNLGAKALDFVDGKEKPGEAPNHTNWGYFGYFLKGFFLNTFNPFTIFFWLGIASALILPSNWNRLELIEFFGAMFVTLMFTDILKALAAKKIKKYLNPTQIFRIQLGISIILFGMGSYVVLKTVFL